MGVRTQAQAEIAVFDFIEGWYNPQPRHSSIGYLSPVQYEKRYAQCAPNTPSPQPSTEAGQLQCA
jgi:putative transposase